MFPGSPGYHTSAPTCIQFSIFVPWISRISYLCTHLYTIQHICSLDLQGIIPLHPPVYNSAYLFPGSPGYHNCAPTCTQFSIFVPWITRVSYLCTHLYAIQHICSLDLQGIIPLHPPVYNSAYLFLGSPGYHTCAPTCTQFSIFVPWIPRVSYLCTHLYTIQYICSLDLQGIIPLQPPVYNSVYLFPRSPGYHTSAATCIQFSIFVPWISRVSYLCTHLYTIQHILFPGSPGYHTSAPTCIQFSIFVPWISRVSYLCTHLYIIQHICSLDHQGIIPLHPPVYNSAYLFPGSPGYHTCAPTCTQFSIFVPWITRVSYLCTHLYTIQHICSLDLRGIIPLHPPVYNSAYLFPGSPGYHTCAPTCTQSRASDFSCMSFCSFHSCSIRSFSRWISRAWILRSRAL